MRMAGLPLQLSGQYLGFEISTAICNSLVSDSGCQHWDMINCNLPMSKVTYQNEATSCDTKAKFNSSVRSKL